MHIMRESAVLSMPAGMYNYSPDYWLRATIDLHVFYNVVHGSTPGYRPAPLSLINGLQARSKLTAWFHQVTCRSPNISGAHENKPSITARRSHFYDSCRDHRNYLI